MLEKPLPFLSLSPCLPFFLRPSPPLQPSAVENLLAIQQCIGTQ